MSDLIFRAVDTATRAHAGQCRKGTRIPYIAHPLCVAELLVRLGCDDEVVAAGILHDTVEDTPLELEDIRGEFGHRVADLVAGATEPDRSADWESRKSHTIEYLRSAPAEVVAISCADKLHNLLSIREDLRMEGNAVWARFSRPRDLQRWYYTELAGVFAARVQDAGVGPLVSRFEEAVHEVFR